MVKPPTIQILLAYLNAVDRLERAIEAARPNPNVRDWLSGLLAINETYEHMTEIPYGILDNQMHCLGIGRQIWRPMPRQCSSWRSGASCPVPP